MKSKREIVVSRTAMTGRMAKGLAAFLMALALVFGFASCKTESEEETVYRTVTYSTEHATAPEKLTVADGTALTAEQLPALTESGYTFGGWYDGETKAEAGYKVTKDVTLTAKWTKNTVTPTPDDGEDDGGNTSEATTYTVTFNTNGGTEVASQKIESGKTATEPTAPTKDGFTFGGWYTDSDFTTAFSFSTEITANITLYAKWIDANKTVYTVTFNSDGTETKQTVAEGEKASKPTDPTKTGYTFAGWYNGETAFDFNTAITANITLTAKWSAITYSITYALDGGTNADANPATYTIESDDITLSSASKTGYTFSGWQNADGETVSKIAKGTTGDITLTALWTTASGITVTIAPASDIGVTSSEDSSSITLTADEGFTGYSWRIDGVLAEEAGDDWFASVSEDGRTLTILKPTKETHYEVGLVPDGMVYKTEDTNLTNGDAYQISLSATKNGIPYGSQVLVILNNSIIRVSIEETAETVTVPLIGTTKTIELIKFWAESGFTNYSWSINGTDLDGSSSDTGVQLSDDGMILTLAERVFASSEPGTSIPIVLTATKNGVEYTAVITLKVADDDESSQG
ncbi:MAG: InlB B-repeat-containing protein [Treponema sp.]|uniref:InlB B-repeat-containing protein n=1 Tax=Treponema sp. TaxID=166 RepID=UPI0025EC5B5C|nr:InlB B-repeat-containing protein [Treponema sp.]MBQ9623101.1 InlB B-repeat-containing protein [Treponema sp.]MBR0497138.1 InlB B-repeat-containing protein [Treponema sp.]